MSTTRIDYVQGTSRTFEVDLVDVDGEPYDIQLLTGATAEFFLRTAPNAVTNSLYFISPDAIHLTFKPYEPSILLTLIPGDTTPLPLGNYVFRLKVVRANGEVFYPIDWSPFDLSLGGVSVPAVPTFDETAALNHNFELVDNLRYMTPGGSPIANAQVRIYRQADYQAGNLSAPVGLTMTNAHGRWIHTVMLRPGFSYVVQFQKPNEYGPDTTTVVL